ncbi:MAG: hypothetical protein LQ343_005205 [Gyalolechia ehrenbergii]|nr:MAG: hypothetical protein LQ343_005205 [Gyalolechia ehrenbergii]
MPGSGMQDNGPVLEHGPPALAPMPFATPNSMQLTVTMASTLQPATQSAIPEVSSTAIAPAADSSPTPLPTKTLILTMTTHIHTRSSSSSSFSSPAAKTSTSIEEALMHGNPEPPHARLPTTTIIGIVVISILAFTIIPLLIFSLVVNYKLKKAIAFQLGQGPRREREWGFDGWVERRREYVGDEGFLKGFRRRANRIWF